MDKLIKEAESWVSSPMPFGEHRMEHEINNAAGIIEDLVDKLKAVDEVVAQANMMKAETRTLLLALNEGAADKQIKWTLEEILKFEEALTKYQRIKESE